MSASDTEIEKEVTRVYEYIKKFVIPELKSEKPEVIIRALMMAGGWHSIEKRITP